MGPGISSGLRLDFAACLLRMNCSLLPTQLLGQQAAGVGGQRGLESAALAKSGISSAARHAKQGPEDHTTIPYRDRCCILWENWLQGSIPCARNKAALSVLHISVQQRQG